MRSLEAASRDMVKRLMTKKKFREEDLASMDASPVLHSLDTAGLERALSRAKAAILKKDAADSTDLSLSDRMTGQSD